MVGQRRNNGQNSEQLRDGGTREVGALCRPGRTEEEKEWSGGVSDPAPALFGPLRAGSLTPTFLVSVVQQIAARICAQIMTEFVTRSAPKPWPAARWSPS
jgi:hypothetical protein